jgi:hypothetical protein
MSKHFRTFTPAEEAFFAGFDRPSFRVQQPKIPIIPRAKDRLPVGTRVIIGGDHPWAGHTGEIVRWETVHLFRAEGPKPVVKLDSGQECFVMSPTQYGRVS